METNQPNMVCSPQTHPKRTIWYYQINFLDNNRLIFFNCNSQLLLEIICFSDTSSLDNGHQYLTACNQLN